MNLSAENDQTISTQIKAFTRWVSYQLINGKASLQINDITKDLKNGVILANLAKILTEKELPQTFSPSPSSNIEMIQNCDIAIEMFSNAGIKISHTTSKDINNCNINSILELIWSLILHYSVNISINSPKIPPNKKCDALLKWAIDRTSNYPNISNFVPYDLSMCALLDSYFPDRINYSELDPKNSVENAKRAIIIMHDLQIPIYIDRQDCQEGGKVDKRSLLTQLSSVKISIDKKLSKPQKPPQFKQNSIGTPTTNKVPQPPPIVADGVVADEIVEDVDSRSEEDLDEESDSEAPSYDPHLDIKKEFLPSFIHDDNGQYMGRKFALTMALSEDSYDEGRMMNANKIESKNENKKILRFALSLVDECNCFLNPAGLKLGLAVPNVEGDTRQQFTFGQGVWNTVVDSFARKGMVWDVSNSDSLNPPAGTQFYLFPFHGRHNQHFILKDGKIIARQNGMVVTYIGGSEPFVMMPPCEELSERQTFEIKLL